MPTKKKKPKKAKAKKAKPASMRSGKHAGFWVRTGAKIIDCLFYAIVGFIVFSLTGLKGLFDGIVGIFVILAVLVNLYLLYKKGFTVGKKVFNLRVVMENGQPLGISDIILREIIGKPISSVILGLGYILIAFDEKKQGLHDKIARTYVYKH